MKNYVQRGITLTVPAPAVVLSGQVVVMGELHGVAAGDAAEGADLDVTTEGVFELPKVAADAFTIGAKVYFKAADNLVTTTASGNTLIGIAVTAAPATTATVNVKLG
ncbi:DUF2190 family protein [Neorhizobium petrolearium]|uniref:DUF2190 family protein n=1 Tax=Neorhizobium petrolearium TaxID=515361 RepID=UPI003F1512A4